jgi:hypothetical protein
MEKGESQCRGEKGLTHLGIHSHDELRRNSEAEEPTGIAEKSLPNLED